MEPITVAGLKGPAHYLSSRTESGGVTLRVPFQQGTFEIKGGLRSLGFWCHYDEKSWELRGELYSEEKEAQLRFLMESGELPPLGAALTPVRRPEAPGAPELADSQGEGAPVIHPAPDHAAAVTPARGERRRRREDEEGEGAAGEAGRAEAELAWEERFHAGVCPVTLRREAGGHYVLEGHVLHNIRPMLERILRFTHLPSSPSAAPGQPPRPRWRSAFPLTDAEREFVAAVVEHRRLKLLLGGRYDDKEPIPPETVVPPRFKPRNSAGMVLRGPYKTREGGEALPRNWGRQFFSTFQRAPVEPGEPGWADFGTEFIWADGTRPHVLVGGVEEAPEPLPADGEVPEQAQEYSKPG